MNEEIFGLSYRTLSDAERDTMFEARQVAMQFAEIINDLNASREKDLAVARLEEALMWTSKHIAIHGL
jgi:hypothetical protein